MPSDPLLTAIEELDINPFFVTGDGFRAVDARARLKRVEVRAPMHLVWPRCENS